MQADGKAPPSAPQAVYDWLYLADRPLVLVRATITQRETFSWPEVHFLELNYPREAMPQWAGGEPMERGQFTASNKSFGFSQWGAILDGPRAIGMFQCGRALFYDGGPGTYLQAHGDAAWQPWGETRREFSAWLWIGMRSPAGRGHSRGSGAVADGLAGDGHRPHGPRADRAGADRAGRPAAARAAGRLVADRRGRAARSPGAVRGSLAGGVGATSGRLDRVERGRPGPHPSASRGRCPAGQPLRLLLAAATARPAGLAAVRSHAPPRDKPGDAATEGRRRLDGMRGCAPDPAKGAEIRWQPPAEKRLEGLRVVAHVLPGPAGAFHWRLKVEGVPAEWSVWQVRFPQVAVADLGPQAKVLLPRGAARCSRTSGSGRSVSRHLSQRLDHDAVHGRLRRRPQGRASTWPCTTRWGSTKDIARRESRPAERAVTWPSSTRRPTWACRGNGFELSGEAVWQLLRGDWFDAAVIYRDWVRSEAKWYPQLGPEGRADTPLWMRELSAWAQSGGAPAECVGPGQGVRRSTSGVPVGVPLVQLAPDPLRQRLSALLPARSPASPRRARAPGVGRRT